MLPRVAAGEDREPALRLVEGWGLEQFERLERFERDALR